MDQKSHEASAVKQALVAVRELRQALDRQTREPIAIIGTGCRVPGASSPQAFWTLLLEKRDAIVPIPASRWSSDDIYDADPLVEGKVATRWAGIIDAQSFDAGFFGIGAEEALHMDPQQRVFLEVAWEALEQAGVTREQLRGSRTGVFAGVVNYNDGYARQLFKDLKRVNAFSGPGVSNSVLAGRLAYLFDLRGPCLAIDTACSSSLVAVHQACQSLRLRECDQAIAGGVNIILGPQFSVATSRMHLMAPDGRCKPFDDRADGIVRSDGCGVVILKRLSDALRDHDPVQALIHGSAVNQDGKTNGMAAPNGHAQEALMRQALAQARLGVDDLGYVEAHGTGTRLGDPIEVAALDRVLATRLSTYTCQVGSVKANIGHCEAAAGIISLIKVVLCLQHRYIPGQLHLDNLNQHMEFDEKRIAFPRDAIPWPDSEEGGRYAAVSAFGWSGTNAQVIVGSAPISAHCLSSADLSKIVPVSGATAAELHDAVGQLEMSLAQMPADQALQLDISSLVERAKSSRWRKAFVADSAGQLLESLRRWKAEDEPASNVRRSLAVVFSGQGAQWPGMVDELLQQEPAFSASMQRCEDIIRQVAGWSLIDTIARQTAADLSRTELAQPCIVAIQVSLFEMLKAWGVQPTAVMGHSVGEFSAACCAGIIDLRATLTAVIHRGRCMEALRDRGCMYAVLASEQQVRDLLGERQDATISAINSPATVIISVTAEGADALLAAFAAAELELISVNAHYPFHCPLMQDLASELKEGFTPLQHRPATLTFVSSSTGLPVYQDVPDADYWVQNAVQPVRFEQAVVSLADLGVDAFVEVGPHSSLIQHIKGSLTRHTPPVRAMATLNKTCPLARSLEQLKVGLYEVGQNLLPAAFGQQVKRLWQHQNFSLPPFVLPAQEGHGHLMGRLAKGMSRLALRAEWGVGSSPLLGDHCMFDSVVVPGAVHLCVLLSHGIKDIGMRSPQLNDVSFIRPLLMAHEDSTAINIELDHQMPLKSAYDFSVSIEPGESQDLLSTGSLVEASAPPIDIDLTRMHREIAQAAELDVPAFYARARSAGLQLGARFRKIRQMWLARNQRRLFLLLEAACASQTDGLVFAPGVLDSCFQALFAGYWQQLPETDLFIPLSIDQLTLVRPPEGRIWGVIDLTRSGFDLNTEVLSGNLILADEQGHRVAELKNVMMKRARRTALLGTRDQGQEPLYQPGWKTINEWPEPAPASQAFAIIGSGEIADQLVTALKQRGHQVVSRERAQDLSDPVGRILYLAGNGGHGSDAFSENIVTDVEQLRLLAERQAQYSAGTGIFVLTQGVYGPAAEEMSRGLTGSASAAVTRVIAREYPAMRCTTIDLPVNMAEHSSLALIARIVSSDSREPALRIMEGAVQRFEVQRIDDHEQATLVIDAESQYLITGGFSETGQLLMDHLINAGARHLILMGRSRPSDALSAQVSHLREKGINIRFFQGDVAIVEDVASLMRSVQRSKRSLKGIYHLAAVLQDGVLARLNADSLRAVLKPKVTGTWNLHQATQGVALDWFIAFSSLSASIGITGQSAYVAANAFIEALMRYRHSLGLPGTAIGWGPWSGGMTARLAAVRRDRFRLMGLKLFTADQVAAIALRADVACRPMLLAADISLPALRTLTGSGVDIQSDTVAISPGAENERCVISDPARRHTMTQILIEELAPIVSHGELTLDTELAGLDIDSLTAVAVVQRIRQRTGKTLPISAFFDSPRLRDAVEKLLRHC
ncbi:SDR family NAD(P)-dependent oxidoreductase [Erwinia amylovora]|uniref:SDR family NAD(P)-dependent oxidoreductase n=1 Tax=Erwinia amylovora TaxID=552 RepID=UPI0032098DBF